MRYDVYKRGVHYRIFALIAKSILVNVGGRILPRTKKLPGKKNPEKKQGDPCLSNYFLFFFSSRTIFRRRERWPDIRVNNDFFHLLFVFSLLYFLFSSTRTPPLKEKLNSRKKKEEQAKKLTHL